ncbi:MAG: Sir2 family NAD-dependent protein deacetylase [Syntrophobacterales bacterium]|jgi:NAD-dependent deacetylase|nr:Sir2 family NAD-dependent protein deacetylase [Syntrophobacterales bacterium]
MEDKIRQIAELIVNSKTVVVFVGAGLSTESGIPDFRSPGGVWDKYDPEDFDFQNFISKQTSREKYWQMATEMYEAMKDAKPNTGHLAIAEMERLGKLDCLITQNIDGLHCKAGNSSEKVLELHGTAMHVSCLKCYKRYKRDEVQTRIEKGDKAPCCDSCGGFLKPATISFGQSMPEWETAEASRRSENCDLFIVIGSSLLVHPAAYMPVIAKRGGARLVIINRDGTPHDAMADIVVNGPAGATMAGILEHVKRIMGQSKLS